ncbi:poly-beta-1,6-N-acetyl-D-glucosamine biosynthesis protein PgaD [Phytobacter diazotrophicus]|uniref:poly-beta-1,6-N-acetyl-D-glucosamine biosynthesis protein PgaD n=1 Tax=Phytobacter diazotrophicus TaxID=395631 RepID=UPI002FFAA21B
MIEPLIFTEQRLFPRMLDVFLTLVAWLGFCWLIYSGLVVAIKHDPFMGVRPFYTTLSTLSVYLLVACMISLTLIGWAKYNQLRFRVERRRRRPGLEAHEVAASFNITPELAQAMSRAQVFTLAHYDTGAIDRVWMAKMLAETRAVLSGE